MAGLTKCEDIDYSCGTPERQKQVHQSVDYLDNVIEKLKAVVSTLEVRLSSVLCDPSNDSSDDPSDKKEKQVLVPLAQSIWVDIKTIEYVMERVEDILARLEI